MERRSAIVFIRRSNSAKRSETLPKIAERLAELGHSIHWFEAERTAASLRINERLRQRWPGIAAATDRQHPLHRRALRLLMKGLLVLRDKHCGAFIRAALVSKPVAAALELDRFVRDLPAGRVHLIAHSAGGISATKISANPKVGCICCLGYPFKHPDRPAEGYRVRHLRSVRKRLLLVQGARDEYAPAPEALAALLPDTARLVQLDCDHDYASLGGADFARVWSAVQEMVAEQGD